MKRFTLGIATAALALGGVAWAAGEAPMAPDKTQTRAEAQAQAEQLFTMMDVNHDGKLDGADHDAMRAQHDAMRAQHEGKAFDRMDANHDGMISRDEFAAGHAAPQDKPKDGPPPEGAGHMRHMMMAMMIMHKADPNHTGVVGKDAFVGAALAMFDAADTNHDGKLSPEERKAAHEKMRSAMQGHMGGHGDHADMPPPPPPPPPGQ